MQVNGEREEGRVAACGAPADKEGGREKGE